MQKRFRILLLVLLASSAPLFGADDGATVQRGDAPPSVDRQRVGRSIYRHSFENLRDPDSGHLLPESASLNPDGWPDFWEPVRSVGFPEYLIPGVRVVRDDSRMIPGAYRDDENHVLTMRFDGTRIGLRTRMPVPIDPALAYEFSLLHRVTGLEGGRIRAGVEWMRVEPADTGVLRVDETPNLSPGQVDWPVRPARLLVNDPPAEANAARLFIIIDRDPESVGGAYHGNAWFDDVTLKPLPKILVGAPSSEGPDKAIPVHYAGLFDNIPDPENPGFFKGKRYSRRVEVTDIHNQPVRTGLRERVPVAADDQGQAVENIPFPGGAYGVYYFNIRLYDADDRLATDVMRAVAVMPPPGRDEGLTIRSGKPVYGISAGIVPAAVLARPGSLRRILSRPGIRMTKVVPWPGSYDRPGGNQDYYTALASEVRNLRSGGVAAAAVIRPPEAMFGPGTLADAVAGQRERLDAILVEAGRHLGLFVDGWQFGDDGDASLRNPSAGQGAEAISGILEDFARGLPKIFNLRLDTAAAHGDVPFPGRTNTLGAYLSEKEPAARLWQDAAPVFPWLFEPYHKERGAIYPPRPLSALAPAPATDSLEEQARSSRRVGSWINLETVPARRHEPNASAEKVQLEQFLIRAVYATVLSPDAVFLGDLFDETRGMLRRGSPGNDSLETVARPTYLAAATLTGLLEGTEYLGQLGLLPPFEAHVFRHPGTDEAVIVVWHNDSADLRPLRRVEIADGPPLHLVDWAGNRTPLPATIPVRRVPAFITGMPAGLALTRMSVRVAPEPRMLATTRRQNQRLEVVNHMTRQAPILFRLRYAAQPDGSMENAWAVGPDELRINLAPATPAYIPGYLRFNASPDPNSPIQEILPGGADKSGTKISQVSMTVNTSPPADMLLYLPFRLQSDIDVDIEVLPRVDDPHFVTMQLKLRWFPTDPARRRGEIKLFPYFMKKGQMRETLAFPIAIKALPPEERDNPDAAFESAELRIPRRPAVQTWVGLTEDGGSGFYVVDVTELLRAE